MEENSFNMDSKAWGLHLLGRDEEALTWMNRSLAQYGTTCSEAESDSYPEALAHRGMILWTLKRRSEALDDWTLAYMATTAGGWANFAPSWERIAPLISARRAQLEADGVTVTACRIKAPERQAETSFE